MRTSSKRRCVLKIFFVILVFSAMTGGGIKIYMGYGLEALVQTLQKAKEKRSAQQKSNSIMELADADPQTEAVLSAQQC